MKKILAIITLGTIIGLGGCAEDDSIKQNLKKDGYIIKIALDDENNIYLAEKEGILYYLEISYSRSEKEFNLYKKIIPIR